MPPPPGRAAPGGGGGAGGGGAAGPGMPPVSMLSEGLRWPGKQLEIKQVAGVVAFMSDGGNRVCEPAEKKHRHHSDGDGASAGRDAPPRARDAPPPQCGWDDKTLIVRGGDP